MKRREALASLAMVFSAAGYTTGSGGKKVPVDAVAAGAVYREGPVTGTMIDSGFLYADSNYQGIARASDGNVYYVLCSHHLDSNACMFRYNPKSGEVKMIGNMNELVGEDRKKVYSQGKVHCDIYEHGGKLWFGTHCGSWVRGGSKERGPYPGGHFMSYDLATGKFDDLGIGQKEQGLLALTMDPARGRLYAITWPDLIFMYYDIASKKIQSFGTGVSAPGVKDLVNAIGPRSLGLDPRTGMLFWDNPDNTVRCFDPAKDAIVPLEKPKLDRGILAFEAPAARGTFWRAIRWNDAAKRFYGVTYKGEYLFSYDPPSGELEFIDRIAAGPNRRSGGIGHPNMSFELSPDGSTAYYITGEEIAAENGLESYYDIKEKLHLVTYDIPARRYTDHGLIRLGDGRVPSYCQGLEIGGDGSLYIVAWVPLAEYTSPKAKTIIANRFKDVPVNEYPFRITELNLIVMKDPLPGARAGV